MTNIRETSKTEANADEALIAFLEAGPTARLTEWMDRYPASRADFAQAATARWAGAPLGVEAAPVTADAAQVARTRAIATDALRAFRQARTAATTVVVARAPLASLVAAAKEQGISPAALAEKARLPYALLFKLHRRLIAPDSVPMSCVDALANALNRTADEIAAFLRMPPTLAAGASYRADAAPQTGAQEGFADALDTDPDTTDAHRAFHSSTASDADSAVNAA